MATDKPRFSVTFTDDTFDKIRKYQKENNISTQSKAVARLVELAIIEIEQDGSAKKSPVPIEFTPEEGKKIAPLYSSEALKLAQDYDGLDGFGKNAIRAVADAEKARCAEQARSGKIIKIAGRDGGFTEICLTDDQIKDLQAYIDRLPDPGDDL